MSPHPPCKQPCRLTRRKLSCLQSGQHSRTVNHLMIVLPPFTTPHCRTSAAAQCYFEAGAPPVPPLVAAAAAALFHAASSALPAARLSIVCCHSPGSLKLQSQDTSGITEVRTCSQNLLQQPQPSTHRIVHECFEDPHIEHIYTSVAKHKLPRFQPGIPPRADGTGSPYAQLVQPCMHQWYAYSCTLIGSYTILSCGMAVMCCWNCNAQCSHVGWTWCSFVGSMHTCACV